VNRLHGERVTEHERDPFGSTDVGKPVPGEHALRSDDEIVTERADGLDERLRCGLEILVQQD
jgi:hypothetical protein